MNQTVGHPITAIPPLANWQPEMVPVASKDAGCVSIDNTGPFEAGSYQSFKLTYCAGRFGIDDTGSLKICWRFASDQARPQFDQPTQPNYVSIRASNGAILEVRFDPKQNTRPWDRTLYIKVAQGFMREGDSIFVHLGDPAGGSPGYRVQTFVDPFFAFRVLVDPVATYTYVEVPGLPTIPIIAGAAYTWHAVLPTWRAVEESFSLCLRADDLWGNPTEKHGNKRLRFHTDIPVKNLPKLVSMPLDGSLRIDGLQVERIGTLTVDVLEENGNLLARSNPLVIGAQQSLRPFWGDLHAQSGETIGSSSAQDYMRFARDYAFLDAVGHQANDFQVTETFWKELNGLMKSWNRGGHFVTVPGYEWSGNTSLGGDRNVFFAEENRPIRRSSHAPVPDRSDQELDCFDARMLFNALTDAKEDAIVWAHCGGRYADIAYAHDHKLERAVEVHSSWGTFEWLVHDAFHLGYRVGIVANSDGHKGRPGAEPPGASLFGALGGLTCFWMPELTREALFEAMRARRHYATTGCRLHLWMEASLPQEAPIWRDDPRIPGAQRSYGGRVMMGDIVETAADSVELHLCIVAASPIISVELRNGSDVIDVIRPPCTLPLGRRVRIEWSGAEYRGRGRQTNWNGTLRVFDGKIVRADPVNFFNPDRPLLRNSEHEIAWSSMTTGNFAGVDVSVDSEEAGLKIETPHAQMTVKASELGLVPRRIDCGKLGRELRAYRLHEASAPTEYKFRGRVQLSKSADNPIYVCVTLENGHQAWSSPIYFIRSHHLGSAG